jgi:hypothetical protein
VRELFHLLDFHRQDKPGWWAVFARRGMDGLVEDAECIGGMEADPQRAVRVRNSTVHTYRY